ncbi:MAG: hypothetical protein ACOYEV_04360 [Candidatus Nanopelagicales bacterium]
MSSDPAQSGRVPLRFAERLICTHCGQGPGVGGECHHPVLSPRTALALHHCLVMLGEEVADSMEQLGERPIHADDDMILVLFPLATWRCSAVWRRQMVRVFDDLAADLEAGTEPVVANPAEEFALGLAVDFARDLARSIPGAFHFDRLPVCPNDFDWEAVLSRYVPDRFIDLLLDPRHDGIEDPSSLDNQRLGMGDYRPSHWFLPQSKHAARADPPEGSGDLA